MRKKTFALYAIGSGVSLGFFATGGFSGFGSYLAEFCSRAAPAGRGFIYNFGRAVGAFFPALIGLLAASIGLSAAIVFGGFAYALALASLLFLPETRGKKLVALD